MCEKSEPVPDVSIVVPVYGNGDTVGVLHRRVKEVCRREGLACEIVFVDDACPFGSLRSLRRLGSEDADVRIIALPRNFGQHRAVLIGLAAARGRRAVVMDADLQDPPEAIPRMLAGLDKGYAAVFAGRRGRYESPARLLTSRIFKFVLHALTGVPRDAGMYVALDRVMIRNLLARRDDRPFVVAMIGASGLAMTSIPIPRAPRPSGRSKYSAWMRVRAGWSAIGLAVRSSFRRPAGGTRTSGAR